MNDATTKAAELTAKHGPDTALAIAINLRHTTRGAAFLFWADVVDSIKDATR
jgi:hypothetical protein